MCAHVRVVLSTKCLQFFLYAAHVGIAYSSLKCCVSFSCVCVCVEGDEVRKAKCLHCSRKEHVQNSHDIDYMHACLKGAVPHLLPAFP